MSGLPSSVMSPDAVAAVSAFCDRHGLRAPLLKEPIGAGRNSRVTRLGNRNGQWILKEYGPRSLGGSDGHDRLGAEFAFLEYLESNKIANVARPLGADRDLGCALYSWLPGSRPTRISADYIAQAVQFIVAINRNRTTPQGRAISLAADACQNSHDHLALIRTRLTQLSALEPRTVVEAQALALVVDRFVPVWQELEKTLIDGIDGIRNPTHVLSPSDFGFHNTLLHQGRLSFVDFEYAGWDDPAKLICDFMCQPELPITPAQGIQFIEHLCGEFSYNGDLRRRVERLLPAHRLKWCCILLNEFRPAYHRRRLHAGMAAEGLLAAQLNKASEYFKKHMNEFAEMYVQAPTAR